MFQAFCSVINDAFLFYNRKPAVPPLPSARTFATITSRGSREQESWKSLTIITVIPTGQFIVKGR